MPDQIKQPPFVLTFAGTDPSSGAGLQADVLTIASMGCHPLSVVTAITVQDTLGVEQVHPVDADLVIDQARTILEDVPVHAFKIGLIGSVEVMTAIAEVIADYPDVPVVLDPVLASGRGDELSSEDMISAMQALLIPQTTVLTPNSLEARRLAEDPDEEDSEDLDLHESAQRLLGMGAEFVLLTGTHEHTPQVINTLYGEEGIISSLSWQRLPGSYHGSGCTLASALAAALAHGLDIPEAVKEAQDFTWQSLKEGFRPGMGQFLPDRLFWARNQEDTGEND